MCIRDSPYSVKNYKPDFTFEGLDLAIEVKLCNKPEREKAIVEEINSDIPAYQTKYRYVIFVIYDLVLFVINKHSGQALKVT